MEELKKFLMRMQGLGLKIDTVYDIGAFIGRWSTEMHRDILPNSQFFLFEANPSYVEILKTTGFPFVSSVLSNPGREFVEFHNNNTTGDSYYKENSKHYDINPVVKLPCRTLDSIVAEFNLPIPNFIKIDTQGSELDILKGAENLLNRVDLIYTECPIVCYNSGAPGIQDYLDYFKSQGFMPVDALEIHKLEETLLQIDIMFMRKDVKEKYLGPNEYYRPWI